MTLDELSLKHNVAKGSSWHNYTPVYEKLLEPIRDKPITFLEIGVWRGESVRMWKEYLPNAEIIGIDYEPNCARYAEERIRIFIGRAEEEAFIKKLGLWIGKSIDVVVDDGSHLLHEIHASLCHLYPTMPASNLYFIEDVSRDAREPLTSIINHFVPRFGGRLIEVWEGDKQEALFCIRRT